MKFKSDIARQRVEDLWRNPASFGQECDAAQVYLQEVVSDRYVLIRGLQLLHDDLQFAGAHPEDGDLKACGADLTLPSVITTLLYTNCGDRVHQGEVTSSYRKIVAQRFAMMSERGGLKFEFFSPVGGGAENGDTLAHVAFEHQLDASWCRRIFDGNAQSFALVNCDLKTHVGRFDTPNGQVKFGRTQETRWNDPRDACGAIVGLLKKYNPSNPIHERLYEQLGDKNYELLRDKNEPRKEGEIEIRHAVAGAIIAVKSLQATAQGFLKAFEDHEQRGVAHLTASLAVNRAHRDDTLIYLARATVFENTIKFQGMGLAADRYAGSLVGPKNDLRLQLTYDGRSAHEYIPEILAPEGAHLSS